MEFGFTQEQEMIRGMVCDFVRREVSPTAGRLDENEIFDRTLFDRMAMLGFTALPWPESEGGAGGGFLSEVMVLEQLSKASASVGAVLWAHIFLTAWPLYRFGTEEQKRQALSALIEGRMLGSGALPLSQTLPHRSGVVAVPEGGGYVLDGMQKYMFNGVEADLFVIYAHTGNQGSGNKFSLFLVDRQTPGLHVHPVDRKLGLRSATMAQLRFERCYLSKECLIGREGQGGTIAQKTAAGVRYGLAAIASGITLGAAETALAYAKERMQFGKPIVRHQAVAFALADIRTSADASILLAYQAAWLEDQGLDSNRMSEMALSFAADSAMDAATNAVQILGGYGYMKEYLTERYMRDAKAIQLFKGLDGRR
ncbi:acyl-CoA dehydrogenase family protein [Paenibacillus tarimensis]